MRYDLNLMPVLVALMEERSVTRAAQRLGVTQPALSSALTRLRAMLGDPLFVRERYGIRPTEKAIELAPIATAALDQLDGLVLGQRGFDPATATRTFEIALTGFVEATLAPLLAGELSRSAPGVRLRLTPFGGDVTETGVMSGTTAMVLGRLVEPPNNLIVQHLLDDGFACVVRADHPVVGSSLTRDTYEDLRHVNVLPPNRLRAGLFQALAASNLKRDVAVSVTHFAAVPEMLLATDYCATLPRLLCMRLAEDPRLKVLAAPVDLGVFPVQMAWHVRYRNDPAHRWFRSLLTDLAAELATV